MILGNDTDQVIRNIKEAVEARDFTRKVEVNDPVLTKQERSALLQNYLDRLHMPRTRLLNLAARFVIWTWTLGVNRHTRIEGIKNLSEIRGGAVVTSNHFNPVDNTIIRKVISRAFHQRLYVVSQDSNLAMKGFLGFLMNYSDIIPLSTSMRFMTEYFGPTIKDMLSEGCKILVYPEQEMWLNYRKPRPPKRGAYYYAATHMVPVISCFVEIIDRPQRETTDFYKTRYILHVLPTIWPDPEKTVKENSRQMMETDYRQKTEAYEKAYGRTLTYDFEPADIAGWSPEE